MRIRAAFEAKGCAMLFDSPTNQQFPILPNSWYNALSEKYAMTLTAKPDTEHTAVRFCTSWATRNEDVDACWRILPVCNLLVQPKVRHCTLYISESMKGQERWTRTKSP